ncbi:non-ribosomal peptide synthetase [Bacillus thuringiensis]|uniref:non-ribosomal peptide synthetase n=1 Tax=Bacillus thuringiensis TaxID=1428 RepID=UPI000BEB9F6D|nr:non-ribosomal peptide synthetase [Bacillus thuringiensis]
MKGGVIVELFQNTLLLEMTSLVELLQYRAKEQGDVTAFQFLRDGEEDKISLTYGELDLKARAIGAWLQDRGAKNERVLLLYPPGIDYLAAFFGCLYAGAIAVPAYPPSSNRLMPRLKVILEDAEAKYILTQTKVSARMRKSEYFNNCAIEYLNTDEVPVGCEEYWVFPEVDRNTIAFLQYTSGSTSTPKGVMVTHGNILHNSKLIQQSFKTTEDDIGVIWLPPYHDMGLIGGLLQPLAVGFPVIFMSPIDFMQRPIRWLEAISKYKATVSGGPNFAFELLIEKTTPEQRAELDLSNWRLAFNGAEPVRAEVIEEFSKVFSVSGFRKEAFYPCYGLAENTLLVSGAKSKSQPVIHSFSIDDMKKNVVSILSKYGKVRNLVSSGIIAEEQEICIVNPDTGQECSSNEIGEIWIKGESAATGYWGREEQTIDTFQAFLPNKKGPFLRSGDLGFLYDGELYITGRIKDLIIIRGRNYYPQDIELIVENSHESLRKNATAAFSVIEEGEERLIVAQEISRQYRNVNVQEVASAIRQAVTAEHGIQVHSVLLLQFGSIPKTSSGKIQRHACRNGYLNEELKLIGEDVVQKTSGLDIEFEIEEILFNRQELVKLTQEERQIKLEKYLLQKVGVSLKIPVTNISVNQSLNSLGLDSITAIQLQSHIETDLEIVLEPTFLLEGPSILQIAQEMNNQLYREKYLTTKLEIDQIKSGEIPMSRGQQGLWFLYKLAPNSSAYNVSRAFNIEGKLDITSLQKSFQELVNRHCILRSSFYEYEGELIQNIAKQKDVSFQLMDVSNWKTEKLNEFLNVESSRNFNLEQGDTMRVYVLKRNESQYVMLWSFHHIVIDYWSIDVLFNELKTLYTRIIVGDVSTLRTNDYDYSSYVNWQNAMLNSSEGASKLEYWEEELSGELPILNLPIDYKRPPVQSNRGANLRLRLNKFIHNKLKEISKNRGVTLYNTLLSAYGVLMYRYTNQDDIIIGSYMAGRVKKEFANLVGYLTNAVPIRLNLAGNPTFNEMIERTNHKVIGAYRNQDYPFESLIKNLKIDRDSSRPPVFQTAFVMQNVGVYNKTLAPFTVGCETTKIDFDNASLSLFPLEDNSSLFDITTTVAESDEGLIFNFQYNTELFKEFTVKRMINHFEILIDSIIKNSDNSINLIPILTEKELLQLNDWSKKRVEYSTHLSIPQLFEKQVNLHGNAVAVRYMNQSLTYEELNKRANQLARYLTNLGVGPEVMVGIAMERSIDLIVGILGVLKAGGAYIPLDPHAPAGRIQYMLEDSNVPIVLTQKNLVNNVQNDLTKIVCLDTNWQEIREMEDTNLISDITEDNLAYVIYTSGSTGNPKGVLIPHKNVVRLFKAADNHFNFNEKDIWTMFHSYAFDFSVWEIWGALLYGGKLIVVPYYVSRDPEQFYELLIKEKVTVLNQTPSAFRQLIHVDEKVNMPHELNLRYVIFGGEALEIQSLGGWFERHGDAKPQLINMYGITETTVHVTYRALSKADLDSQASVIGTAIPDLQVYILNQDLQHVPIGVIGEMYIGGAGVARGYLNKQELTEERFVKIPSLEQAGLVYKSGDLARYLPNGDIEYLGRIDDQVKIRGFRIELGEIEAILNQYSKVREGIVLVREDVPGDKKLIAYIVGDNLMPTAIGELRNYMSGQLPEYMVPSAFVLLDKFPLTINGKVDKKVLPAPDMFAVERAKYIEPETQIEKILADTWEEVLGIQEIGIDDNFFLIGGDSIRSIKICSLAKERGLNISLEQIFKYQTIRDLSKVVDMQNSIEDKDVTVPPFSLISEEDRRIIPNGIEDAYPIPAIQMTIYYHSEVNEVYRSYLETYRLRADFNEEIFNEAINRLVKRHEIFRTSFDISSYSKPLQLVHENTELKLNVQDLRHMNGEEQEKYLKDFVSKEEHTKFDWSKPGLFRFHVHLLSDEIFQFTMCEPILDGWSVASTVTELLTNYRDLTENPNTLESKKLNAKFNRYVQLEQQTKESKEANEFWESKLQDVSTMQVPRWLKTSASKVTENNRLMLPISQQVSEGLIRLSRKVSVPLKDVVLAAHLKVVSLLTGQTDVVTGVVAGGRPEEPDAEKVLGSMINTMPFRLDIGNCSWEELVCKTFDAEREAHPYRRYPLVDLQRKYSGGKRMFETIFNYTHFHAYQDIGKKAGIEILNGEHRESAYVPLTVQFSIDPQTSQLMCVLDYYPEDINEEQINYISGYYVKTLELIAQGSSVNHHENCLLSNEEIDQVTLKNDDEVDFSVDECFHILFDKQVKKTPDNKAIVFQNQVITYQELQKRSNCLANYLKSIDVKPGMFVGYFGERNIDWAITVIGIFKAGAVYIPLDPKYPESRIEYLIEHSGMDVLLTYEKFTDRIPKDKLKIVSLDSSREQIESQNILYQHNEVTLNDLAYIIYTSGSTGLPKGVMVEHKGMINHLFAKIDVIDIKESDIVAQNATQCFDVSVWQLLSALLVGGQTYILPDEAELDPEVQLNEMEKANLTVFETVPTVLQSTLERISLNEEKRPSFSSLRWVVLNGETLPPELCRQWFKYYPDIPMINACGATESSDDVNHHYILEPPALEENFISIGKVIPNCTVYILDQFMNPVPIGVPGELCYGGVCVGRGYLNDKEKTEKSFRKNPFTNDKNERLYKTGDLVRLRNDGAVEFLGRIDYQVKIRGFRIELGEVEAILSKHPDIIQVVALAHTDSSGNKRLIAYLTLEKNSNLTTKELRNYMKELVPAHMIPSFFVFLDEFPITSTGKLDRKNLPDPMFNLNEDNFVEPKTDLEKKIAKIWGNVLGYQSVSMRDDFFENGGESLIATRLISLIRKEFQIDMSLRTLFEVTTVEGLVLAVKSELDLKQNQEIQDLISDLQGLSEEEINLILKDGQ